MAETSGDGISQDQHDESPPRASIYDVAARAGVSHMTVSRALNGHPQMRESTRQRVLKAVADLNYTRSPIARALVTKRAMRIGVLMHGQGNYGPNTTLRAFERAAHTHGYAVSAISIDDEDDRPIEMGVVDLVTQGVDAVCVIAPRASSLARLSVHAVGLPMIVARDEPDDGSHVLSFDHRHGAARAVEHLIELGHRSILHLAGPLDWYDARSREIAWRETLNRAGLPVREPLEGDWSADAGYAFAKEADLGDATAIFVANDQMAVGVLHGLKDRGLRVPEDISVVGFDDVPEARHLSPPLTTVRQDFTLLGQLMMHDLLAMIEGRVLHEREHPKTTLIVRESTMHPPVR